VTSQLSTALRAAAAGIRPDEAAAGLNLELVTTAIRRAAGLERTRPTTPETTASRKVGVGNRCT
jgi:hypothetical protein